MPGAPSYVHRKADDELYEALTDAEFCYVLDARQIGKSSLMVSTAVRLRQANATCVILDLTSVGHNVTVDQWYFGMLITIGAQTGVDDKAIEFWDSHAGLGPMQRLMQAVRDVILPNLQGELVIFVDEIDSVRSLPFSTDEFFAGIRECYNRRTEFESFRRLTFCLMGVATPDDLIANPNTTPFNIGRRITLGDFVREEALPLAEGLDHNAEQGRKLLDRILYWTDGHPYLTQRLCKALADSDSEHSIDLVDELCHKLFLSQEGREHDDNLLFVKHRLLSSTVDQVRLLELYSRVVRGEVTSVRTESPELLFDLLLSGAVKAAEGKMRVRNRLYARVFNAAWVKENMPEAERRRQRLAFRRGLLRSAGVFGVFLIVLSIVVFWALKQAHFAQDQQSLVAERSNAYEHLLYLSRISLAQQQLTRDPPNTESALQILRPYEALGGQEDLRGFEWGYLWRVANPYIERFHRGDQDTVAVSALSDGRRIAIMDAKSIEIWDAEKGTLVKSMAIGKLDPSVDVAYSPDSGTLAFAYADGSVGVVDLQSGKVRKFEGGDKTSAIQLSKDGRVLAWISPAGRNGGSAHLRNLEGGESGDVSLSQAADSGLDRAGTAFYWIVGHDLYRWMLGRAPVAIAKLPWTPVSVDVWSQDEILLGSAIGDALVMDGTGHIMKRLDTKLNAVESVRFLDADRCLIADQSGLASVWNLRTGEAFFLGRQSGYTPDISASSDGKRLIEADEEGFVEVYPLAPRKDSTEYRLPARVHGSPISLAIDPAFGYVFYWTPSDPVDSLNRGEWNVRSDATAKGFSGDGSVVVEANPDGTVDVLRKGSRPLSWQAMKDTIVELQLSKKGDRLMTLGKSGSVILWSVAAREKLATRDGIAAATLSGDGKSLAVIEKLNRNVVRCWTEDSEWQPLNQAGIADPRTDLAFRDDGRELAVGSAAAIQTYAFPSATLLQNGSRADRRGTPTCVVFPPDGKRIIEGDSDGAIAIIDAANGELVLTLNAGSNKTPSVQSMCFTPDGTKLYAAFADGTIRLWQAITLKQADQSDDAEARLVRSASRLPKENRGARF